MLVTSKYNFIWPTKDEKRAVIYNSFTGALMEAGSEYLAYLQNDCELDLDRVDDKHKNIINQLYRNGYLIEDFTDEIKLLKFRNSKGKYNKESMTLTILPTFRCNLRCFYCFQDRTNMDIMTQEVQDGIIEFVKKSIKGLKNLHICWFGGEPLMAWDIVCRLSERLLTLAKENDCNYSAMMVTNGYLLDHEKIQRFKELNINSIQITLDGPPTLHSKRKGIKEDPIQSFHKIVNIIQTLLAHKINVRIRINIDKTNMNGIEELMDNLAEADLQDAHIYPAVIEPYTNICSNVESGCLNREEFAQLEAWFNRCLLEKGLRKDLSASLPVCKDNFCVADQIYSFSIAPNGYVYKCWNTIGDKNSIVKDILDRETKAEEQKRRRMYLAEQMTWDPFKQEECLSCKLLPVCMGGCPYRFHKLNGQKPDCLTVKDNIRDIITNHINSVKVNQIFN